MPVDTVAIETVTTVGDLVSCRVRITDLRSRIFYLFGAFGINENEVLTRMQAKAFTSMFRRQDIEEAKRYIKRTGGLSGFDMTDRDVTLNELEEEFVRRVARSDDFLEVETLSDWLEALSPLGRNTIQTRMALSATAMQRIRNRGIGLKDGRAQIRTNVPAEEI